MAVADTDVWKCAFEAVLFVMSVLLGIVGYFLKRESDTLNHRVDGLDRGLSNHRIDTAKRESEVKGAIASEFAEIRAGNADHREKLPERFVLKSDYTKDQITTDNRISAITKSTDEVRTLVLTRGVPRKDER